MTDPSRHNLDERISAYFDGELTEEEVGALQRELQDSPAGQAVLRQYSEMRSLIRGLPAEELPGDLRPEVLRRISASRVAPASATTKTTSHSRWKVGLSILATAAGMLFLVWSNPPRQDQGPMSEVAQKSPEGASTDSGPVNSPAAAPPASPPAVVGTDHFHKTEASTRSDAVPQVGGDGQMSLENRIGTEVSQPMVSRPIPPDVEFGDADSLPSLNSETTTIVSSDGKRKFEMSVKQFDSLQVGETVRALQRSGDEVSVVNLFVVDRDQALDSLQLILSSQKVSNDSLSRDSRSGSLGLSKEKQNGESSDAEEAGLVAVYVEASESQVAAALEELKQEQQQFVELAVDEPVKTDEVSRVIEEQFVTTVPEEKPGTKVSSEDAPKDSKEEGLLSIRRFNDRGSNEKSLGFDVSSPMVSSPTARQQVVEMTPGQLDSLARSRSGGAAPKSWKFDQETKRSDADLPQTATIKPTPAREEAEDKKDESEQMQRQMQVLFVLKQRPQPQLKARIPPVSRPASEPGAAPKKD